MAATRSRSYTGGSLAKLSNRRSYVKSNINSNTRARDIRLEPESIYVVIDDTISITGYNAIMAYYVSRFYPIAGHHNVKPKCLLACVVGIIANSLDFTNVRPWPTMMTAMGIAGIDLQIIEITGPEFGVHIDKDERTQAFLKNWPQDIGYILQDTYLCTILSNLVVLAMTKQLNTANHAPWCLRRVATFGGTLGDMFTISNVAESQIPALPLLQSLNAIVSANHLVRKEIFREIIAISMTRKSFISESYAEINHLMRGHEMNFLALIDQYIFNEHPELLRTTFCRGLVSAFADAIATLKKLPPDERMYAKILLTKDECTALNKKNFGIVPVIATAIAQFKNSQFENFYAGQKPSDDMIRAEVLRYMNTRHRLFELSAGGWDKKSMCPEEFEQFNRIALRNLEIGLSKEMEMEESDQIELPNQVIL